MSESEIKHRGKPGQRGYHVYSCRCDQGCLEAGLKYLSKRREKDRVRRARERGDPDPEAAAFREVQAHSHGIAGYEKHGCRCEICVSAHGDRRDRERERTRVVAEPLDWSGLEHLKPGAGVRRRTG